MCTHKKDKTPDGRPGDSALLLTLIQARQFNETKVSRQIAAAEHLAGVEFTPEQKKHLRRECWKNIAENRRREIPIIQERLSKLEAAVFPVSKPVEPEKTKPTKWQIFIQSIIAR